MLCIILLVISEISNLPELLNEFFFKTFNLVGFSIKFINCLDALSKFLESLNPDFVLSKKSCCQPPWLIRTHLPALNPSKNLFAEFWFKAGMSATVEIKKSDILMMSNISFFGTGSKMKKFLLRVKLVLAILIIFSLSIPDPIIIKLISSLKWFAKWAK